MKKLQHAIGPLLLMLLHAVVSLDSQQITSEEKHNSKVVQLYEKALPAVMGMLPYNDTLEFILGSFLTDKESESIWPKIIKETEAWFGERHSRKSLTAMERNLKKYQVIILKCHRDNTGKELTRCLSVLKDELLAGEMDFQWVQEQLVPLYLNFYSSFNLMKLASLQLLKIQQEKDPISDINVDSIIKEEAKSFAENLKSSVATACEQRVQRVTVVQICKVVDVLWQEYTDLCEERYKRTIETKNESITASGELEVRNADKSDIENDVDMAQSTSNLGGNQNEFTEALRGQVKDSVTEQYIYNKRMSVSASMNKAKVMQNLYEEGLKARNTHVGKVKEACLKYWKPRGSKIAKEVQKLVKMPKKKANRRKNAKQMN